jgi:CheY-like chemotaxis protein/nitrogen-specific signal transduction histidine kinase
MDDRTKVCVCQDISDRKRYEENLRQSNRELERATRLKDEFLANMSHELRTPLNSILGMAEGLQEQIFGSLNERQTHAVATMERSGRYLLELINDILDLSKIESGKLELHFEKISIANICDTSLVFVRQMARQKNIQLHKNIPDGLGTINADDRRLRQILINLLTNAVKFTPEGGSVTLEVGQIPPEEQTKPSKIVFSVVDTGIGISPEDRNRLFQEFVQIDSRLNRKHNGTGLGLSLVRRLTELHGGTITVDSEVGKGSRFTVTLPYEQPACDVRPTSPTAMPVPSTTAAETSASDETSKAFVLLVEDNEANISTMSSYLSLRGYRVAVAKNGQEAVEMAIAQQPDCILMDIQMPDVDGLEATRQIRSYPPLAQTPIFALTALAMAGDREKCLEAGANEYITKPVQLKQLTNTIDRYLQKIP